MWGRGICPLLTLICDSLRTFEGHALYGQISKLFACLRFATVYYECLCDFDTVCVCGGWQDKRTLYSPLLLIGVAVAKQTTFISNERLRLQQQNKTVFGRMHTMWTGLVRGGRQGTAKKGEG